MAISAAGAGAPPGEDVRSPETYAGYAHTERFVSPGRMARDTRKTYSLPLALSLNQWGLGGLWNAGAERAELQTAPGKVVFRFHSRDLHMVLGPPKSGGPVRFKVTLDGAAPGDVEGRGFGNEYLSSLSSAGPPLLQRWLRHGEPGTGQNFRPNHSKEAHHAPTQTGRTPKPNC